MNSKVWIRKALSMCMILAVTATYSMVALANTGKIAGEILVTGKNIKVNGEEVQSGRSIFSSSMIVTPENANAVVNLGKAGKIELAPNTTLALNFNEKSISADLSAGKITVLGAAEAVNVTTVGGKGLKLNAGESATATGKAQDDDDDDNKGGAAWLPYVLIFGGAVAGIVVAATLADNETRLGGGTTVVSPTR